MYSGGGIYRGVQVCFSTTMSVPPWPVTPTTQLAVFVAGDCVTVTALETVLVGWDVCSEGSRTTEGSMLCHLH